MKYQYVKYDCIRTVELSNCKVTDERTKEFSNYRDAKRYFENLREIERKRGSKITLLEQGPGYEKKVNKRKHNSNFNEGHKVKVMRLPVKY